MPIPRPFPRSSRFRAASPAALLLAVVAIAAGCGQRVPHSDKPRADVVVKLTYDGKPITEGSVDLNNLQTGEGGGATLDATGTARISGVVLGDYVVTVFPPVSGAIPGEDTSIKKSAHIALIYRSPEKSPLKLSVTPEGANAAFELKQ